MRRAKARWVRVFPPAGNRKKQRQRSLLLCTPARPQRSARSPAVFARVGLLTDAFRGYPQRARPAFSPRHYSSSNDPLSQHASPRANKRSAITATKPKACRLRSHVRDLHPIPFSLSSTPGKERTKPAANITVLSEKLSESPDYFHEPPSESAGEGIPLRLARPGGGPTGQAASGLPGSNP